MESNIPYYTADWRAWKNYLLDNGRRYYKQLTFKDLKKKKMFKHINIKPGSLYIINPSATRTNIEMAGRVDIEERITFIYVIDYKNKDDYEIISMNYVRITSKPLSKSNSKDIGFIRDVLKESGTDEYIHWLHNSLILNKMNNIKEEYMNLNNKGKIEKFYSKFWHDEWKDPANIMGIKREVVKSPLSLHLRPEKRKRNNFGISYLYGKNNKHRLKAKGMASSKQHMKGSYDLNITYIGNSNRWKLLQRRPVIYDNRIINWTNTYKINN